MPCPICFEEFNVTTRKEIHCPKCEESFCMSCIKRYITETDCSCLSCKGSWDFEFLVSVLTKSFMNKEYREIQAQKLFEKETSLLPSTMYFVDLLKQNECLKTERNALEKKMSELREMINEINLNINSNLREVHGLDTHKYVLETNGPCPKEDCRGFILRTNNKCGVCDTVVCKDCREIKAADGHVCVPENVESAKLISKDSRPCPKCGAFIYKIDGCDQMWCSLCKTAFSWKTGQIEKGRIHNPHYYDWLRTQVGDDIPREPEGCDDQILTEYQLRLIFRSYNGFYGPQLAVIFHNVVHLHEVVIAELRDVIEKNSNNKDLRISYLMNSITENYFRSELEKRARIVRKTSSLLDCLVLFYDVVKDNLRLLYEACVCGRTTNEDVEVFLRNYKKISVFTNDNIEKAEKMHGCSFKRHKIT